MLSIGRVFLVFLLIASLLKSHEFGILAKSITKRSLPQYMEEDHTNDQPPEYRSHIAKIHPKKSQRSSNEPIMNDVTDFRGIGQDRNIFGGPRYDEQLYPFGDLGTNSNQESAAHGNFTFGKLLAGLALWNLASEFNMYSNQEPNRYTNRDPPQSHELATNGKI